MTATRYRGVIVPLVTPLDERGAVSETSVQRLVDSVRGDVAALMPTLSSGEGWKLSEQQWIDMVRHTRQHADSLPVLSGIQLGDTPSVIARARIAMELGVDAIVVTPPHAKGISQDEIYDHFRSVRTEVDIPLFIYNKADESGDRIEMDTLIRVCRLAGVAGIKESSGSAEFTRGLLAAQTGVPVFQGWENLLLESRGVAGYVVPLANLEPGVCNAMLHAPSVDLQATISSLCDRYGLFRDDWYLGIKQELLERGIIESDTIVETARMA